MFKTMLERLISVLHISERSIWPGLRDVSVSYEKQIVNFVNINRPRKQVLLCNKGSSPHLISTPFSSHNLKLPNCNLMKISLQRHFYLAVNRHHFKMEMWMDLLGVVGRHPGLPMVVCCSSRDELDAVCSAVTNVPYISLASLFLKFMYVSRMVSKSLNMHRPKANNPRFFETFMNPVVFHNL